MFIRTQENSRSGSVGLEGGNNLAECLRTTHVRTGTGGEVVATEKEKVEESEEEEMEMEEEEERGGALISLSPGSRTWRHTRANIQMKQQQRRPVVPALYFCPLLIKPPSRVLAR